MRWPKKGSLILIEWNDITSLSGWREKREVGEARLATIATVGFFMEVSEGNIKVCQSVILDKDSDDIGEAMIIPISVIKKVHRLK